MCKRIVIALCGLALWAPAAAAQRDEVHIDPGSPSGKEYALPVDRARSEAATGTQARSSATQKAPLFGEGVGAASTGGRPAREQTQQTAAGGRDRASEPAGGKPRSARVTPPAGISLEQRAAAPEGAGGLLPVLGIAASVLLAGAIGGLLLRRRAAL